METTGLAASMAYASKNSLAGPPHTNKSNI